MKVELPVWKSMDKTYKSWFEEIREYFAAIGEHRLLEKDLAPKEPEPATACDVTANTK